MYMAQISVAPLRREANGLGSLEIDREHPHVVYSRANPTRNLVTDLSRPGYNININNLKNANVQKAHIFPINMRTVTLFMCPICIPIYSF